MNNPIFVDCQRGGRKLLYGGFGYTKLRTSSDGERLTWRCVKRDSCHVTLTTNRNGTVVTREPNEHHHAADWEDCKAEQIKHRIKRSALEQPNQPPSALLSNELRDTSSATMLKLSGKESLKKMVRREQHRHLPAAPKSVQDIIALPDIYRTLDGRNWLIYDNGPEQIESRMLVFASDDGLQLLKTARYWISDGTFKVVPSLFAQLYTIHAPERGKCFPCIYAIMANRTRDSYVELLQNIKRICRERYGEEPAPAYVSTDFKSPAIDAYKEVLPDAQHLGCFFHFSQILWRKLQAIGLQAVYRSEEEEALREHFRSLIALSFLHCDHIEDTFDRLCEVIDDRLTPICDHLEDNYIRGRPRRGRRQARPPSFPKPIWNCHERVLAGLPRTTNSVEAWHSRLNTIIGKAHVSFYAFIEKLQAEERVMIQERDQLRNGRSPPRKKKKYITIDSRITSLINDYDTYVANNDLLTFLRRVGHVCIGHF